MKYFLIAENDPLLLKHIERLLKSRYEDSIIHVAHNEEEILGKAKLFQFSAILSGVALFNMNALRFYQRLMLEIPSLASRVGFISSSDLAIISDIDYVNRLKEIEVEGIPVLANPFTADMLYAFLDEIFISSNEKKYDVERRHERKVVNNNALLAPLNLQSVNHLEGTIVDISDGGFKFQYENNMYLMYLRGIEVNVASIHLDIFNKKAEMVWKNDTNGDGQAGFRWM